MIASSRWRLASRPGRLAHGSGACRLQSTGAPMQHVVEVTHMVNGDLVSFRRLSAFRERVATVAVVVCVVSLGLAAMVFGAILVRSFGRAIFAPWFVAVWALAALTTSILAVLIVRRRLRRYVLGSSLQADAFAAVDVDLVRREGSRFDLTIVPGMKGHVGNGRAPLPVEALVGEKPHRIALGEGATAELSMGASTFVIRSRPGTGPAAQGVPAGVPKADRGGWIVSRDHFKLFSRLALAGLQVGMLGTVLSAVPRGQTIGDRPAHLVAPRITTPWEAEKWLRIEAQAQSRSLHQCFDPLPLACQHSGYVGVGVSLTRDGEVRSNWISRSTYGSECPVDQCIKELVSTWVFDPLPEAMRVVLPIQVLRTAKPLPTNVAQTHKDVARARVALGTDAIVEWDRGR